MTQDITPVKLLPDQKIYQAVAIVWTDSSGVTRIVFQAEIDGEEYGVEIEKK